MESAATPRFTIEGHDYINFGSNNYLSLSYHPQVIEAAQRATQKYGTGVTGSRLLNGTLDLHRELEDELADFYGREAALVFSTGYVANVSTIAGLLRRQDYAVLDKDAHNSLVTGAQLSGATLEALLAQRRRAARAGARATSPTTPARPSSSTASTRWAARPHRSTRCVEICREHPNTFLLDDEAHGLGVLGERGRGAAEHYGVLDTVDLITLTFSKTLGSCGGALIGSKEAIELLTLEADTFIFTASNTPGSIAAALAGPPHPARRAGDGGATCARNVDLFVGLLADRGVPVNRAESAIITIPLRKDDEVSAVVLARELLDAGVFVNPVVSPAVQKGLGLLRLSLMLDHTPAILEEAAQAMLKVLADNDQLPDE